MTLSIPANAGPQREQAILDLVAAGQAEITWATLISEHDGHRAEFQVFADALKIEGVRVNMSAKTQQLVADMLSCSMLTAKLADLIWEQRDITIQPFTMNYAQTTAAMIAHSEKIDGIVDQMSNPYGLICTVGKHWILDNAIEGKFIQGIEMAMNYGWHFDGPTFAKAVWEACASIASRLIQGRGGRHDKNHTDYSQTCVLIAQACMLDGLPTTLEAILSDPALAPLANHDGVLRVLRQPGA